ncbi:probable WRKY transcription factor 53 [Humulus lupulus]|uniref:probable WRKY transcription factor 53 n=1 Tax=Humulus lupulus TaxID=3486 RepID=UPI002B40E405|nr:probable WRKY transcription factor 53 [Humulus lupulus]
MGDWEQKNLLNELTRGKELAGQLQLHLINASSPSSHETGQYLVQKILVSYEKALSMLNWPGDHPPQPPPVLQLGMSDSPPSLTGSPRSEDSDRDQDNKDYMGSRKRKSLPRWTKQVRVSPGMGLEGPLDDGFSWRKYGQKDILGAKYPRGYYRCTHRNVQGCLATKQVQRSDDDPTIFEITYRGRHTCTQAPGHVIGSSSTNPTASADQNQEVVALQTTNTNNNIINNFPLEQMSHQHQPQAQEDHILSSLRSGLRVITEGLKNLDDGHSAALIPSFHFAASSSPTTAANNNNTNVNMTDALAVAVAAGGEEQNPAAHRTFSSNNYPMNMIIDDSLMREFSPSFVSPAASGTNYFSSSVSPQAGHHHHEFGGGIHETFHDRQQDSESDQIAAVISSSAANTSTIGPDFQFGQGEFDSNFTFDNSGFFS